MKNKLVDKLMDEIEFIDDDIILSAATCKPKKKFPFKKVLSLAACFVVLCVGSFLGYKTIFSRDNDTDGIKGSPDYYENSNKNDDAFVDETFPNYSDKFYGSEDFEGSSSGESLRDEDLSLNDAADKDFSSKDIYAEEEVSEGDGCIDEPTLNDFFITNTVLPPSSKIVVDDLNKLAYFSGWKILKEQGALNSKNNSELYRIQNLNPLSKVIYVNEGFGVDTSEMDVSAGVEIDTSGEYIGGDLSGMEVVFADVKQLTVNSVQYFRILVKENSFLANMIGVGNTEVMILDVEFENNVDDIMIVFKNGNNFFSCFLVSFENNSSKKEYVFSPSKFASNYNVIKNISFENNTFKVVFNNDSEAVSEIFFNEINNSVSFEGNIPLQTYNYVNNIKVSNTVSSLNSDLYDIYIKEFPNGETSLPPEKIETLEKPNVPEDFEHVSHIVNVPCTAFFQGDGKFLGDIGYEILTDDNKNSVEEIFPNDDFSQFCKSLSENKEYVVVWIRGNARHSSSEFIFGGGYVELSFEYVLFQDYTTFNGYSVFVFEKDKLSFEISKVVVNAVEYSTTVTAVFTTDNEYDYGIKNEDEYEIYTFSNSMYQLYKNGELIYENEYKVSYGYICLVIDNDVLYLELSPYASFVYPMDDFNRIFKLI